MFVSFVNSIGFQAAVLVSLGALLDAAQLMTPETLEGARPLVERPDGVRVGAIEHVAALAAYLDQAHFAEHAKVLRNRRLLELEAPDDIPYGALLERKEIENLSTTWLGDSVEGVGSGGGSRHGLIIHSHTGICQAPLTCCCVSCDWQA
jgi:hypothetical protein